MEKFKLLKGIDKIDFRTFCKLSLVFKVRGNTYKLVKLIVFVLILENFL